MERYKPDGPYNIGTHRVTDKNGHAKDIGIVLANSTYELTEYDTPSGYQFSNQTIKKEFMTNMPIANN